MTRRRRGLGKGLTVGQAYAILTLEAIANASEKGGRSVRDAEIETTRAARKVLRTFYDREHTEAEYNAVARAGNAELANATGEQPPNVSLEPPPHTVTRSLLANLDQLDDIRSMRDEVAREKGT